MNVSRERLDVLGTRCSWSCCPSAVGTVQGRLLGSAAASVMHTCGCGVRALMHPQIPCLIAVYLRLFVLLCPFQEKQCAWRPHMTVVP
jgi:hypothetical protein